MVCKTKICKDLTTVEFTELGDWSQMSNSSSSTLKNKVMPALKNKKASDTAAQCYYDIGWNWKEAELVNSFQILVIMTVHLFNSQWTKIKQKTEYEKACENAADLSKENKNRVLF